MVKYVQAAFLCGLFWGIVLTSSRSYADPVVTLGEPHSIDSALLNKKIPLSVHLPENYHSAQQSYPVLVMMGSDYRTRFAMLAATLDYMADTQIPAMILVGIDLPEGNRVLLPKGDKADTTIPDSYIAFMESELLPYINQSFRSAPFRTLFGASNSGFFSLYTLLQKPALFNSFFASSPSVGAAPELLTQRLNDGPLKAFSETRWLHIVYSDDDFDNVTQYVPEFTEKLIRQKPAQLNWKADVMANQGHVPATDFTTFLLHLYPDYNPAENLDNLTQIQHHFAKLSTRYGYKMLPPLAMLFDAGVELGRSENLSEAEKLFQHALQLYPTNKKAYVGMGWLLREKGEIANAREMFEKALQIAPDYSLAKRLLQSLQE